jgi:hypothetical protein
MSNVLLTLAEQPVATCGEATAKLVEEDYPSTCLHTTAPSLSLDVYLENGHVLGYLDPENLGECAYHPATHFDFNCREKADNIHLLCNLRDAIDAILALNAYTEGNKNE